MHYYCPTCRALIHESEVEIKDGIVSHWVMSFVRVDGSEGGIIHTGLIEDY